MLRKGHSGANYPFKTSGGTFKVIAESNQHDKNNPALEIFCLLK